MFVRTRLFRAGYDGSYWLLLASVVLWLTIGGQGWAQTGQTLGSIIGRVHAERGDGPPQRILVNLDFRGASMNSVFTDAQGTFGFHTLAPNQYTVRIDDEHYQRVEKSAVIENTTMSPVVFVDITLVPKSTGETASAPPVAAAGSNLNMIDARAYAANFPKSAMKEFKKGQQADAAGKRDEAIRHYEKAVTIAPDYYFAHNNLGSDYQIKSDFPAARKEFQRVVELNQSDAAAYFNLSNVCMLSGQLPDAKQYLDEGMRRQPDSALGQFLLGSLNLQLRKFSEAESALRRAMQLDPFMAQARLQLVNLLLKEGRKPDAASLLRDFIATFPDNPFTTQAKLSLQRLEVPTKQ
jgi:tetratricopeptide (TPR) repeat protein